jgi:hypothetical protein
VKKIYAYFYIFLLPQCKLRFQLTAIENDPTLDTIEKTRRKQNLLLLNNLHIGSPISSAPPMTSMSMPSTMSPHAPSFYPTGDTVESVVGNALDEDLNLGELTLTGLERELGKDNDDTNSVCSSLSTGFPNTRKLYQGFHESNC